MSPRDETARGRLLLVALASGLLFAGSFPPLDRPELVWIGLAPLLWAVARTPSVRWAALCGFVAGSAFGLVVGHPVTSASAWTGWATLDAEQMAASAARRSWALTGVWIALSLGATGIFWGLFAGLTRWLARRNPLRLLVAAPPVFVLVAEAARSRATWGFPCSVAAQAAAEFGPVRQLAALGGPSLIGLLVVAVNAALAALLLAPRRWRGPAAVATVLAFALAGGALRQRTFPAAAGDDALTAAALQHTRSEYRAEDYLPFGLDRDYWRLVRQIAGGDAGEVDLLVLPESVAFGSLSLDGSRSRVRPDSLLTAPDAWQRELGRVLGGTDTTVVLGLETVEGGRDHNSLVTWTADGLAGWYHKRKLVPFGEYQPALLASLGLAGTSQFAPGRRPRVVNVDGVALGSFVCQEVLFPELIRDTVTAGAEVLVSGGNDGVFTDPAVARAHHSAARLRAVEADRYLVRAMKTGVSAILSPTGDEIAVSPSSEPALLTGRVEARRGLTPYARLGPWPLWLAGLSVIAAVAARFAAGRREATGGS